MSCFLMASKMDSPRRGPGRRPGGRTSTGWCLGNREAVCRGLRFGSQGPEIAQVQEGLTWYTSLVALSSAPRSKGPPSPPGSSPDLKRTKGATSAP